MRICLLLVGLALSTGGLSACGESPITLVGDDFGAPDMAPDLAGTPDLGFDKRPMIDLTFSGCAPDFSKDVTVVSNNGSIGVTRSDAPLLGQIQLHLVQTSGLIGVSTADRTMNGNVINVIAGGIVSTNISSIKPDPIKGTLAVHGYDEVAGVIDLEFTGVVVENVQDQTLCTIDGTLVTHGKTF